MTIPIDSHSTSTTLTLTKSEWLTILTLATRWYFLEFRKLAIQHLDPQMTDPVEMIQVGRAEYVPRWVKAGYEALVSKTDAISEEESDAIGDRTVVRLYIVRHELAADEKTSLRLGGLIHSKFALELQTLDAGESERRTEADIRREREEREAAERLREEEERVRLEEEAKRLLEEAEAVERRKQEVERKRLEDEEKRRREELQAAELIVQEAERKRLEELEAVERRHKEEERKRMEEEEKKRMEDDEHWQREEELRKKVANKAKKAKQAAAAKAAETDEAALQAKVGHIKYCEAVRRPKMKAHSTRQVESNDADGKAIGGVAQTEKRLKAEKESEVEMVAKEKQPARTSPRGTGIYHSAPNTSNKQPIATKSVSLSEMLKAWSV